MAPKRMLAVVAHDRIDVGGELLAALEGAEEALPAQVLPGRLRASAPTTLDRPHSARPMSSPLPPLYFWYDFW